MEVFILIIGFSEDLYFQDVKVKNKFIFFTFLGVYLVIIYLKHEI